MEAKLELVYSLGAGAAFSFLGAFSFFGALGLAAAFSFLGAAACTVFQVNR